MTLQGPFRFLIGAFGDPGHAFPAIALGKELRARGHEVALETWKNWRGHVEREGMRFLPAPEFPVFPTRQRPLRPYEAVALAVGETRSHIRDVQPDVVVNDILTLAPALAAELEGCPWATLVPHVYPPPAAPTLPPYGLGAMPPRRSPGQAIWRALSKVTNRGLERGRRELNETRRRVGLPELSYVHGGISRGLCLVGTLPQLEYPRAWPAHVHVTGPILWEPPAADVELPPGDEPLVLVAPSTSQDPDQTLVAAALRGLTNLPVRLVAIAARGKLSGVPSSPKMRLVEWLPYSRTIPRADVVVCHGGHGTLAHALAGGAPVVTVPAAGDMSENGTRAQWAGAGLSLPRRFLNPRTLRWVVQRVLDEPAFGARAAEMAAWARRNNGPANAASLVERFAASL